MIQNHRHVAGEKPAIDGLVIPRHRSTVLKQALDQDRAVGFGRISVDVDRSQESRRDRSTHVQNRKTTRPICNVRPGPTYLDVVGIEGGDGPDLLDLLRLGNVEDADSAHAIRQVEQVASQLQVARIDRRDEGHLPGLDRVPDIDHVNASHPLGDIQMMGVALQRVCVNRDVHNIRKR